MLSLILCNWSGKFGVYNYAKLIPIFYFHYLSIYKYLFYDSNTKEGAQIPSIQNPTPKSVIPTHPKENPLSPQEPCQFQVLQLRPSLHPQRIEEECGKV